VVLGVVATAIIQSSSAVTSLTGALVDAGTMMLRSSLGVLLGANIGTTSTAWLVSLKLTGIGPFLHRTRHCAKRNSDAVQGVGQSCLLFWVHLYSVLI
jgi:Na+/phosphate symporter